MYTVYADDLLLYHPLLVNEGHDIINPTLTLEENKSGSFTFTLLPTNELYNHLSKLTTIITVYDNNEEIFRGRILDDEKDFYNRKKIYCEGQLAFLLDSIVRPYAFEYTTATYFRYLIENHNSQVEELKQFKVGNVTIDYAEDTFIFGNDGYTNTWEELTYQLIDCFGGRIIVRLEEDGRYIDYLAENEEVNSQVIEFGLNMVDISQYITAVDVTTRLIPLGAKDEAGNYLTIMGVNNGKDYIENETGVSLFGKITKTYYWDDITDPNELLEEAEYYLESNIEMAVTLTVKAVDLHLLNVDTSRIKTSDILRVISTPHGIDSNFKCSKVVLKLQNPENNEYSLGASHTTLTDKQNTTNKNAEATLGQITNIQAQVSEESIVSTVVGSTIYKENLNNKVGIDEVVARINASKETISILAKKIKMEGLVTANSYFKILEDGSIEAVNGVFKGKVEGSSFIANDKKTYTYSNNDITRLRGIIEGTIEPTLDDYAKLDINGSKDFTESDATIINGVINGVYDNTPGIAKIEDYIRINSENSLAIEIGRSINGITIAKNLIYGGGTQVDNGSVLVNGENVVTSVVSSLAYFG